jgi:hypothetical protein
MIMACDKTSFVSFYNSKLKKHNLYEYEWFQFMKKVFFNIIIYPLKINHLSNVFMLFNFVYAKLCFVLFALRIRVSFYFRFCMHFESIFDSQFTKIYLKNKTLFRMFIYLTSREWSCVQSSKCKHSPRYMCLEKPGKSRSKPIDAL